MSVVIVTGWRKYYAPVELPDDTVIVAHGGCTGADRRASEWAQQHNVSQLTFPVGKIFAEPCPVTGALIGHGDAAWSRGAKAGPIRNKWMLEVMHHHYPNAIVMAYHYSHDTYRNSGTADCVARAQAMGIPVVLQFYNAGG